MNSSTVRVLNSEKNLDQGGLTNTVPTDQSYPPTRRQLNADVAKKMARAVCLSESRCSEHSKRRYPRPGAGGVVFAVTF